MKKTEKIPEYWKIDPISGQQTISLGEQTTLLADKLNEIIDRLNEKGGDKNV